MAEGDLTVVVLREIRDEIRETRKDLGGRIDQTNTRLDQTNTRLDRLEVEFQKMAEAIRELAAQQLLLGRYVKNIVDRHEQAIDELRERVTRLETRPSDPQGKR